MAERRFATITGAEKALDESVVDKFNAGLRGEVLRPGDPDYDRVRKVWNGMIDKRPALIVRCAGTADVVDAVTFARDHDLLVSVRGGGHNIAGASVCERGVMIDLSRLNGIKVDAVVARPNAWVARSRSPSFAPPSTRGVVSTTGVGGLTPGWRRR
jgi:FAD/FMN-containing dehydrogenase